MIAEGPPSRLLEKAIDGEVELVFPEIVRSELHRVLGAKLGFTPERATDGCELIERVAAERPGAPRRIEAITGDPADDAILASAVEADVDILVTGDRKHVLPLGRHRGIRILTPQALLAELLTPS
jgi:predicted nucleic acid-binding protein